LFCSLCAADNPNDGRFCVKCGAVLQGQRGMPPPGWGYNVPAAPYVGPTETSGKAIGSLICGLLFFFFPTAVIAIILGHLSLSDIGKAGGRLTGNGLATTGLVLGYMGVAFIPIALIVAAIAIPNLLRAKIAANEASAVGSLRTINTAATIYQAMYSNGFPPGLKSLKGSGNGAATCGNAHLLDRSFRLIPPVVGDYAEVDVAQKSGYRFTYVPTPSSTGARPVLSPEAALQGCKMAGSTGYEVHADPISSGTTGLRSFYSDQTGVIRFNVEGPATFDSPRLE
jgi:type IV pilus assembly protein PilA